MTQTSCEFSATFRRKPTKRQKPKFSRNLGVYRIRANGFFSSEHGNLVYVWIGMSTWGVHLPAYFAIGACEGLSAVRQRCAWCRRRRSLTVSWTWRRAWGRAPVPAPWAKNRRPSSTPRLTVTPMTIRWPTLPDAPREDRWSEYFFISYSQSTFRTNSNGSFGLLDALVEAASGCCWHWGYNFAEKSDNIYNIL